MSASLQLRAESLRSILIEMLYCPKGPDTDGESDRTDFKTMAHGTAFVYRLEGTDRLITARHNVTGKHWQTSKFLSEYETEPTHLRVLLLRDSPENWTLTPVADNPRAGSLQVVFRDYLIPLIGEDWKPIWKQHPILGGDMDVAEVPFDPPDEVTITSWERTGARTGPEEAPWPAQVFPGEDVFIIGYPYRIVVGPIMPLWIRGTVASDPMFGYTDVRHTDVRHTASGRHAASGKSYPLWLVDARTRRGQSGAPVIRQRPPGALVFRNDGRLGRTPFPDAQLLGVYSGRTSDESDLGFVWGMDEVDEICRNGTPGTVDL